ncbi:hypothetical protein ADICEAN_02218 [Cesiribacter andamanensis AMV16]|uniref:Uncharacterized protein n=1 Tax=Cesiribacter andamanensis AMV16 TaxID=1279009 RepID=M7NVW7_9BACT|nr:hypothetical protein ADICEAN_02218 [Cesiribacter andamanensis AMV16]
MTMINVGGASILAHVQNETATISSCAFFLNPMEKALAGRRNSPANPTFPSVANTTLQPGPRRYRPLPHQQVSGSASYLQGASDTQVPADLPGNRPACLLLQVRSLISPTASAAEVRTHKQALPAGRTCYSNLRAMQPNPPQCRCSETQPIRCSAVRSRKTGRSAAFRKRKK